MEKLQKENELLICFAFWEIFMLGFKSYVSFSFK